MSKSIKTATPNSLDALRAIALSTTAQSQIKDGNGDFIESYDIVIG